MDTIIDMHARQILDSRGNPTLEVEVYTQEFIGSAAVPSGASTGVHEAVELRDKKKAYGGLGVEKAVEGINGPLKKKLLGCSVLAQAELDDALCRFDGTLQKKKYGANALLGVSLAVSRAASAASELPLYGYLAQLSSQSTQKCTLPLLFANVINGGVHAGNALMPQEFMIVPTGAKTLSEAVAMVTEFYHELKKTIAKKYGTDSTNVGDEGGFAPPITTATEALQLLSLTAKKLGLEKKISFAMDPAASEFYDTKKKVYEVEKGKKLTGKALAAYWLALLKKYPLISLEDPFAEDDFASWQELMTHIQKTSVKSFACGKRPQIVGDDLTVTNPARIQQAIERDLCNALLLKVNQIGTLSEALHAAQMARDAGWNVMVSHRSGETEDPYIADLAVGLACGQIKLGAPCRSDRTAKYNQLLRIAEELEKNGTYAKFSSPKV